MHEAESCGVKPEISFTPVDGAQKLNRNLMEVSTLNFFVLACSPVSAQNSASCSEDMGKSYFRLSLLSHVRLGRRSRRRFSNENKFPLRDASIFGDNTEDGTALIKKHAPVDLSTRFSNANLVLLRF